jgi:phosphate/sulfate permease
MLSIIITILLSSIMTVIIGYLVLSALLEHYRLNVKATQASLPAHPLDRHVTAVLYMQDGVVVGSEKPTPSPAFAGPSSWYSRRRTLFSLVLLLMVLLAFLIQGGFAGEVLQNLSTGLSLLNSSPAIGLHPLAHMVPLSPSELIARGDSAARNQYHTDYEWQFWSYSSCSGFAMAEVMNAYGRHLIAADVLEEEQRLGVWSVYGGLLNNQGIVETANYFGFNASLSNSLTLQQLIVISDKGTPVIVSVQDKTYFPSGHVMVIRGGDEQYIYTVDSSPENFTRMSYSMFLGMWSNNHFSAILTPR